MKSIKKIISLTSLHRTESRYLFSCNFDRDKAKARFYSHSILSSSQSQSNISLSLKMPKLVPLEKAEKYSTLNDGKNTSVVVDEDDDTLDTDVVKIEAPLLAKLRYDPGDKSFTFSFTFPQYNKEFNFNRLITENLKDFTERIKGNILKKRKKFEGDIKLIFDPKSSSKLQPEQKENIEEMTFEEILGICLDKNSKASLKLQIDSTVWDVDFNPPEVNHIKFGSNTLIGFPVFPFKLDTSSNFSLSASKYKWEYLDLQKLFCTKEDVATYKKKDVIDKKFNKLQTQLGKQKINDCWVVCSTNFVYVPEGILDGSSLRFTCYPSDGNTFGDGVTAIIPGIIKFPAIKTFLFEERLSRMTAKRNDPDILRVVTYNILADCLATTEWFTNSPPESLEIDYRLPCLLKELISYEADIICLQEVDRKLFQFNYEPLLSMTSNLQGFFSCKDGTMKEGLATFYNPEKLNCCKTETIVVREYMEQLSFMKEITEKYPLVKERLDDRNTIFQLTLFQDKKYPQKYIFTANVHLYFHPNADHIRAIQTITCLTYLEEQVKNFKAENPGATISVIFFGDFNCTPPYSSVRLLKSGKITGLDEDWTCYEPEKMEPGIDFEHNLGLVSIENEELTNIVKNFEGCIDYIFYQPENLHLVNSYPPPSKAKIASIINCSQAQVSLPNFYAASDHLPLIADFSLVMPSKDE